MCSGTQVSRVNVERILGHKVVIESGNASLPEQLRTFASATLIVAAHGAGLGCWAATRAPTSNL